MCLPLLGDSTVVARVYHFVLFIIESYKTGNDFLLPITIGFDVLYGWLVTICQLDTLPVWEFSMCCDLASENLISGKFWLV